jgi:hypothetical protein
LAIWMEHLDDPKTVHFLGGSEVWHEEVRYLAEMSMLPEYRFIRGMDTSMPFNYAYAGQDLNDPNAAPTKRPKKYFQLGRSGFDLSLVDKNVDFFVRNHQ